MSTTDPNRHEAGRPAFEAAYWPSAVQRTKLGNYQDREIQRRWEDWCRALDWQAAQVCEWKPIETAPKDGTRILVLTENGVDLAWWVESFDTECRRGKWVDRGAWTNGGVESWGMQENIEVHPTHWMPLPAPPAAGT